MRFFIKWLKHFASLLLLILVLVGGWNIMKNLWQYNEVLGIMVPSAVVSALLAGSEILVDNKRKRLIKSMRKRAEKRKADEK